MSLLGEFKKHEAAFKAGLKPVALYSFVACVCMLAQPMFLSLVYDKVLASRSMETLLALTIFATFMISMYGFFDSVRMRLISKSAVDLEAKMAGQILAAEFSRQSDTTLQTVRDISAVRQTMCSPGFAALFDLPAIPLFVLLVFLIHPYLGLVLVVGALLLLALAWFADKKVQPKAASYMEASVKSHRSLEQHAQNQEIIRAQGMYNEVVADWGKHQGKALGHQVESFAVMTGFSAASKSARQILQISIIGVGAVLVVSDMATAGVIFAASIIGGRALAPIDAIVGSWRNLKQGYATYQRLLSRLEMLELPDERTELPRPKGSIKVDRVAYAPRPGAEPIIRGISGQFAAGESVAVIGPSGAGKSTFSKLLAGYLEPTVGRIALDGQDIKSWDSTSRGLYIGYMPQQITFFEATVRENIARLRMDDPEDLAIKAAQTAGVHDMILKLPQGYDTPIAKGGFWPSGGQSQLIALARAFYANPSVLILDEPNAALDQSGEAIFHAALGRAKKLGMTVILVTQRPSALKFTDKVMILEQGLVKEFGDRDSVLGGKNVAVNKKGAAQVKPRTASKGTNKKVAEQKNTEKDKPADVDPAGTKPHEGTAK